MAVTNAGNGWAIRPLLRICGCNASWSAIGAEKDRDAIRVSYSGARGGDTEVLILHRNLTLLRESVKFGHTLAISLEALARR
jgi:hypothetical protein